MNTSNELGMGNLPHGEVNREDLRFADVSRSQFRFLEEEFGFNCSTESPTFVQYQSPVVLVNVFHGVGFQLGVEFGLKPPQEASMKRGWLFKRRNTATASDAKPAAVYDLQSVIPALASEITEPRIQQGIGHQITKLYNPWFVATDVDSVASGLMELASYTKKYAQPLLEGDKLAFEKVQKYDEHLVSERTRHLDLSWLPPEIAEELKDRPLSEIIAARRSREGW